MVVSFKQSKGPALGGFFEFTATCISKIGSVFKDRSLYENQIQDINPLASLTNFKPLLVSRNRINDISVIPSLTSLTQLSLDHNQISDISMLSGLDNLSDVSLGYNQIADISPLMTMNSPAMSTPNNPLNEQSLTVYLPQLNQKGGQVGVLQILEGLPLKA